MSGVLFAFSVIGAVSGILTILGYLLPAKTRQNRWSIPVYTAVVCGLVSLVTWQASELERHKRVEAAAQRLLTDREMHYSNAGFVQAGLAFLEKNKDLFPDAYMRASIRFSRWDCSDLGSSGDASDCSIRYGSAASEMEGLIEGIAVAN